MPTDEDEKLCPSLQAISFCRLASLSAPLNSFSPTQTGWTFKCVVIQRRLALMPFPRQQLKRQWQCDKRLCSLTELNNCRQLNKSSHLKGRLWTLWYYISCSFFFLTINQKHNLLAKWLSFAQRVTRCHFLIIYQEVSFWKHWSINS